MSRVSTSLIEIQVVGEYYLSQVADVGVGWLYSIVNTDCHQEWRIVIYRHDGVVVVEAASYLVGVDSCVFGIGPCVVGVNNYLVVVDCSVFGIGPRT